MRIFFARVIPWHESRSGFPARRAWRVGLESPTYVRIFFARVIRMDRTSLDTGYRPGHTEKWPDAT